MTEQTPTGVTDDDEVDDAIMEDLIHCRYCGASCDVTDVTLYGATFDVSAGTRSGGVAICEDCLERFDRNPDVLITEVVRLQSALRTIRDHYGQVCDEYETCTHPACAASYGAWAVADEALAGVAPNAPRGVAESALDGPRGPKSTNGPSAPISGATGRNTQGGAE